MTPFRKRTFTLPLFLESLALAGAHLPILASTLVRPDLSPALREKVMLAVTSVNDCRYCEWVHTGLALANDVDLEELAATLGRSPEELDDREAVAILFGQHFADTQRRPEAVPRARLHQHFSAWERRQIMAWIHAIYFANLTGNSADAVLARLSGRDTEGNALVQAVAALVGAPVLLGIWLNSRRPGKARMSTL